MLELDVFVYLRPVKPLRISICLKMGPLSPVCLFEPWKATKMHGNPAAIMQTDRELRNSPSIYVLT